MSRTVYFAYGSNMDVAQMDSRCSQHVQVGTAALPDWRFRIMERGYATIVKEPGAMVWGLLWDLGDDDVRSLDRYEGLARGLYFKQLVRVRRPDGEVLGAIVYTAADTEPGTPEGWYIGRIISGARVAGLPEEYIAELESWVPTSP